MKCKKCKCEPFGVESWFVPRGEGRERDILCPKCSGMGGGLNIIENDEVIYRIGCETIAEGEEDVMALLRIMEDRIENCQCGKCLSAKELKKSLTKVKKDDIIPSDINN